MEKNREFLNLFWDLAADEQTKRIAAANQIVLTSKTSPGVGVADVDYIMKRLIRGLSSSREAARHGFATCLCQLLDVHDIDIGNIIKVLEENTKVTGSMRGHEERDLMFGKLFGVLAILRSKGSRLKDADISIVIDILIDLHGKKAWLREVTTEAILFAVDYISAEYANVFLMPRLEVLFENGGLNTDVELWQLTLATGLNKYGRGGQLEISAVQNIIPRNYIISTSTFAGLTQTLLSATAGFPKMNRVWDYVLGEIFPMDSERSLPTQRSESLSALQEQMLLALVAFIDGYLIVPSHEKRGVAFRLALELVKRCPSEFVPVALSKTITRSLVSARVNKKHTLHALAGVTIKDLVRSTVGGDSRVRLALASAFVHHGGADFDNRTQTNAVAQLLEGLDADAVVQHIRHLCHIIGSSQHQQTQPPASSSSESKKALAVPTPTKAPDASKKSKKREKQSAGDAETEGDESKAVVKGGGGGDEGKENAPGDDEDDAEVSSTTAAQAALEALVSLCKNARIANRADMFATVLGLLIRISCFGAGTTASTPTSAAAAASAAASDGSEQDMKKNKKSKKSKKDSAEIDTLNAAHPTAVAGSTEQLIDVAVSAIRIAEGSDATPLVHKAPVFPDALRSFAATKLLSLLADFGQNAFKQLAELPSAKPAASALALKGKSKESDGKVVAENSISVDSAADSGDSGVVSGAARSADDSPIVIDLSMHILNYLAEQNGLGLHAVSDGEEVGEDEEEEAENSKATLLAALAVFKSLREEGGGGGKTHPHAGGAAGRGGAAAPIHKLRDALKLLLTHATFQVLAAGSVDSEVLGELASVTPALLASVGQGDKVAGKKADEEDEEEPAQGRLLDSCMELLSVFGDQSVKGVRDAVKKVWTVLAQAAPIEADTVDAILAVVTGEGTDGDAGDGTDHEVEEEGDDGEEEDDDDIDEEGAASKKGGKAKAGVDTEDDDDADDDSEGDDDDDVMLTESDAFHLLSAEDGDDLDDLEGMMAQHGGTAEQDAALLAMIRLRQESRKQGLLQAQRRQLLVRTRAVDILEILIHRTEDVHLLLPLLSPLLRCLRKAQQPESRRDKTSRNLQEAVAFELRIRTLIDQKLCKKRLHLPPPAGEEVEGEGDQEEEIVAQASELCSQLSQDLRSPFQPLRETSLSCLLLLARAVLSGPDGTPHAYAQPCRDQLAQSLSAALTEFVSKKSSRVQPKLFDELLQRFPDFTVCHLFSQLAQGCSAAKTAFLRAECSRLVGSVLRRHKSLKVETQAVLEASLPSLLSSLADCLGGNNSASGGSGAGAAAAGGAAGGGGGVKEGQAQAQGGARAKRMKPVLACGKDAIALVKARQLVVVAGSDLAKAIASLTAEVGVICSGGGGGGGGIGVASADKGSIGKDGGKDGKEGSKKDGKEKSKGKVEAAANKEGGASAGAVGAAQARPGASPAVAGGAAQLLEQMRAIRFIKQADAGKAATSGDSTKSGKESQSNADDAAAGDKKKKKHDNNKRNRDEAAGSEAGTVKEAGASAAASTVVEVAVGNPSGSKKAKKAVGAVGSTTGIADSKAVSAAAGAGGVKGQDASVVVGDASSDKALGKGKSKSKRQATGDDQTAATGKALTAKVLESAAVAGVEAVEAGDADKVAKKKKAKKAKAE